MNEPVSDERLAELISMFEKGWVPVGLDAILSALRELQRLRAGRVPPEPIRNREGAGR